MSRHTWTIAVVAVCAAVAIGAVAYAAGKTTAPEVVRARRFELVDFKGNVRATLSVTANDKTSLRLLDGDGEYRVLISGDDEMGSLSLAGADSNLLMVCSSGHAGLGLYSGEDSDEGRTSVGLSAFSNGLAKAYVSDNKVHRLNLEVDSGKPRVELIDEDKTTRAILGCTDLKSTRTGVVEQRPESSLVFFDEKGKVLFEAP